jgi:hypothetical protein
MTFFFDENFPINATRILDIFDLDNEMRHCTDLFEKGTPDVEWIEKLSKIDSKSVVVSHDGRILRNKVERKALVECNLTFVYFTGIWAHTPWNEFVWRIVKIWPNIIKNVSQIRKPTIFEVTQSKVRIS